MAESIVQSAAQTIGNLLVEEAKYLYAVSDQIKRLEEELEWMQLFLKDADARQHDDAVVRKWVSKIKELAYEAEDIIEKYILRVSLKRQDGFWNTLKWFSCIFGDAAALHEVGSDVDDLTQKISFLTSRMTTYGVNIRTGVSRSSSYAKRMELRRTFSHVEEDDPVGLESDSKTLVGRLVNQECKIVVVSGMGGLGKTTLAKKVYHHPTIRQHFQAFSWVHVSQQFQTQNVLKEILLDLTPKTESGEGQRNRIKGLSESELPDKVCKVLKDKPYLVVLDDVWTQEDWKRLQRAFRINDCSSKLLVTTRNKDILREMDVPGIFQHEPKELDMDQSWKLLKKKAAGKIGDPETTDAKIEKWGRKMLAHCRGLPLAIVVLGGVLATKRTPKEWEAVYKDICSSLDRDKYCNQPYKEVYDVLALSYHDLPYHLKPCFLHLGNFPEDYEIPTEKLYQMWIAEGLVTLSDISGVESLEDAAERYLNNLVQRSMVQVGEKSPIGGINTCRLHDLEREMCLEMVKEENFLQVIGHNASATEEFSASPTIMQSRFRRLAVYLGQNVRGHLDESPSQADPHLRSLLLFHVGEFQEECWKWVRAICNDLLFLRVLDFEGLRIKGSFPKEVKKLVHLRYLSLKETSITELPSSIGDLRYLLTLDLRVRDEILIPNVLWKLRRLRHLYLPRKYKTGKRDGKLHLHALSYLMTLENVNMSTLREQDLLELSHISRLSVVDGLRKESLELILQSKSTTSGRLRRMDLTDLNEVPNIRSRCQNLQGLEFRYTHNRFWHRGCPITSINLSSEMLPENLTSLVFYFGELLHDPMPIVGKLPCLRFFALHVCFCGLKMVCSGEDFPQLTYLKLDGLFKLREWVVEKGAFPNLAKIEIWNCPIRRFPDVLPITLEIATNRKIPGIERYKLEPGLID